MPLEPDLSWWVAGRCVFAGDCKYKRAVGTVPNADVYQMLAYLTALHLPEGLLIYAAGKDAPRDVVIAPAGKRVQMRSVDVARPPAHVLADIRVLAGLIRGSARALLPGPL